MKYRIALIVCLLSVAFANAQLFSKERIKNIENFDKKRLSYGYILGFNSLDYNFDYNTNQKDIQVKRSLGFNVGLLGNLRINEFIDLRLEPTVNFTTRTLEYDPSYFANQDEVTDADLEREVKATYIHVPLLVKLSTRRVNNIKPFIVGGISTALNLSSNEDNPEDNSNGQFRAKKNVLFYEFGLGIDLYLHWFKFTPSIRGVFAINDEIVQDKDPNSPWTSNVKSMKTRGIFINFTFQ